MSTEQNGVTRVQPPTRKEIRNIRALIVCGAAAMLLFLRWFINPEHIGYAPIFWLLSFGLLFKLLKMVHEWYHYWSPSVPERPESTRQWTVDVLTTACPGEPYEMIDRTLRAMVAIRYPHTSYLCDEGNDPALKKLCDELGVVHVTRTVKKDAKAGNINNALRQATGEICVVLDPDHVPVPEFLDRTLPYFENPEIGFVQCVQAYGNQCDSFVARGAAEQTYHFYGPMMMCMNTYGTVQAIGANCTFRRSALDSIGGHAAGLSEDMHTAMQLHAKGWKSIYIPELLTRGLVPSTLSAYYKQQLKWSRGTFELLFRTLPSLYKNFTWRQKLHYLTLPMYFLFGLINFIDIAIPLIALSLAEVPWEVNIGYFGLYFLPLCGISLLVRLYAQRWLVEKHEHGLHLAGGILRMATWWIFLIGFIYTIFNIRVPYIPTPKEDEHENYVRLSVPNFIVLLLSLGLVAYGLSIDWTPYSFAMASYSLTTAGMLAFTVLMSQQKFIRQVSNAWKRLPALNFVPAPVADGSRWIRERAYSVIRSGPAMIIIALSMMFLSYSVEEPQGGGTVSSKELGGLYIGSLKTASAWNSRANVAALDVQWPGGSLSVSDLNATASGARVPFVSLIADSVSNARLDEISQGAFDASLQPIATAFRNFQGPVFVSFRPSSLTGVEPLAFIKVWQHLYTYFNQLGISNLTWVWCPPSATDKFYPGEKFVDWIGVRCVNYGTAGSSDRYTFAQIYEPYRKALGKFEKPVMITALGCVSGSGQQEWFAAASKDIAGAYKEIAGVMLFDGSEQFRKSGAKGGDIAVSFAMSRPVSDALYAGLSERPVAKIAQEAAIAQPYTSPFMKGSPGHYTLAVNGKPFYIRGVAYNTAHDWRDGNMPLTRRQVEKDFARLKEMGCNTIRRYGSGIYDRNVLNIAEEYNLNVLYGFWFDPKVDYFADEEKVREYLEHVEETVLSYKDHKSVLAWSVGNETWGLLKHRYAKPYLTSVRMAYTKMIEKMARRIHELDPTRPVFTCMEHEEYQLPGEIVAFRDQAPSLDAIGVNSYYRQQISTLNHVAWQFDSLRPYIVSEFGPAGYWDPKYNREKNHSVIEESDQQKAEWYAYQWTRFVKGYEGYNIGGFAYCWHDRMEGSLTWFGLTDFKGRPKPAYFALQDLWTGSRSQQLPSVSIVTTGSFVPGAACQCSVSGVAGNSLQYEWRLLKDEYLDNVDNVETFDDARVATVTVPESPSNYRLYVYVSKDNAWVTTASVPIRVTAQRQ